MEGYYFLFFLALIWTFFASVHDLRKREVANWLTFSLILFALTFRFFYAFFNELWSFFWWGVFGFLVYYALAYAFYYGHVFAGGDAKLLMGFGALLPVGSLESLLLYGGLFIFLLFFLGALYSLVYSIFIVFKNPRMFKKSFLTVFKKYRFWLVPFFFGALVVYFTFPFVSLRLLGALFVLVLPGLLFYLQAVEQGCMIQTVQAGKLTEGDWLAQDVRIHGMNIRMSVHGLDAKEILILRKHHKSVLIKQGIPFVPVFLLTLLVMGLFFFFFQQEASLLFSLFG